MTILKMDSFADIRLCLNDFQPANQDILEKVRLRENQLTKPAGALGRLEDISAWFFGFRNIYPCSVSSALTLIFAGNHGVTARNISAFPAEVTQQMVLNFQQGGAAINQLCDINNSALKVIPLWLDSPTKDFTTEAAMTENLCLKAIKEGFQAVDKSCDLLCLGEMGIGNTSIAAALSSALFGGEPSLWAGRGTGLDDAGLSNKITVLSEALSLHAEAIKEKEPLEILCRLGGYEIAAMVGAIIAARLHHIPVLLDGYVCCAAASIVFCLKPDGLDHCLCSHVSAEPGHRTLLEKLHMQALLDMNMRLGEASGAVLSLPLIRAAIACHNGMARFDQAQIDTKKI